MSQISHLRTLPLAASWKRNNGPTPGTTTKQGLKKSNAFAQASRPETIHLTQDNLDILRSEFNSVRKALVEQNGGKMKIDRDRPRGGGRRNYGQRASSSGQIACCYSIEPGPYSTTNLQLDCVATRMLICWLFAIVVYLLPSVCVGWLLGGTTIRPRSHDAKELHSYYYPRAFHVASSPIHEPSIVVSNLKSQPLESSENTHACPTNKAVGLWLDLRETAIFPKAALAFLDENLSQDAHLLVDKVILSEDTMEELIRRQSKSAQPPSNLMVLYVPDSVCPEAKGGNVHDLIVSNATREQSIPCGKVIQSDGVLFNPLTALDIVISQRGWVLLEPGPSISNDQWLQEVSSLMTFLSSSWTNTSTTMMNFSNGLVLPTTALVSDEPWSLTSAANNEMNENGMVSAGCGMAILCSTRSLLVDVSKAIMTQSTLPKGISPSDGGILWPSTPATSQNTLSDEDKSLSSVISPTWDDSSSMPIAVAIPLDIQLWETAMEMFTWDYDSNNYYGDDDDRR